MTISLNILFQRILSEAPKADEETDTSATWLATGEEQESIRVSIDDANNGIAVVSTLSFPSNLLFKIAESEQIDKQDESATYRYTNEADLVASVLEFIHTLTQWR